MQSINFLGKRGSLYQKNLAKDHKLFLISLVCFGAVVLVFLALLGFNIFLGVKLQNVTKKQNETRQSIVNNQTVEASYLLFSNKLKAIGEIFEKRNNKQQAINYLSNLFGDSAFIGGVNYDGEAQILSLTVSSDNIFSLDELVKRLDSEEVRTNFASLNKGNIRRTEEGRYEMKLTIELKPSKSTNQKPAVKDGTKEEDGELEE